MFRLEFQKIDKENWARKNYFEHYFKDVPCTYSMTFKLDITQIIETQKKIVSVYVILHYNYCEPPL